MSGGSNIDIADTAPNYEFDVYALEPICDDGGSGVSNEVIGDIMIICAQVNINNYCLYFNNFIHVSGPLRKSLNPSVVFY